MRSPDFLPVPHAPSQLQRFWLPNDTHQKIPQAASLFPRSNQRWYTLPLSEHLRRPRGNRREPITSMGAFALHVDSLVIVLTIFYAQYLWARSSLLGTLEVYWYSNSKQSVRASRMHFTDYSTSFSTISYRSEPPGFSFACRTMRGNTTTSMSVADDFCVVIGITRSACAILGVCSPHRAVDRPTLRYYAILLSSGFSSSYITTGG